MKTLLTSLFTLVLFSFFAVTFADAAQTTGCQQLFGGGETCKISTILTINKKVLSPSAVVVPNQKYTADQFVENVQRTSTVYGPNQPVAFRLEVTNISGKELKDVKVTDFVPAQHVTFLSGDGEYNRDNQTFTTSIPTLKKDETQIVTLQLMTARLEDFKSGDSLCTLNRAEARVGNEVSEDNAIVCVSENKVLPANTTPFEQQNNPQQTKGGQSVFPQNSPNTRTTPQTGPELLLLSALIPAAGAGLYLRRKTS
jgi:uncharacterized repeat protein (TIGR01451 family)